MANEAVSAAGLLSRALDPATQPPEIRASVQAEMDLLTGTIGPGMAVIDLGCGTGRHRAMLGERLRLGVGVDDAPSSVGAARRRGDARHVYFLTGDATAVPIGARFACATHLTNTGGSMSEKAGVLRELRRLAPRPQTRLLTL